MEHSIGRLIRNMDLKKIELYLDQIIENNEIEDALDWMIDIIAKDITEDVILDVYNQEIQNYTILLLTFILEERFMLCAKVRDVVEIITNDCRRLIKLRDIEKDEKFELLCEIDYIYQMYRLSLDKLIELN